MAKRLAIIGGGAAGFFLAINVKSMVPDLDVTIYEKGNRVLRKVEVSGGGRCNCTNTFAGITDLRQAYPRGASLLKRLFKNFGPRETYEWFENHGVPLTIQPDQCVFPQAQDSHAIINCFLREAQRLGVKIKLNVTPPLPSTARVGNLQPHATDDECGVPAHDYVSHFFAETDNPSYSKGSSQAHCSTEEEWDGVCITIGGIPHGDGCVPSLFTFNIKDEALHSLMGTVAGDAIVSIPGTKFRAQGPLLVTHWGMSGPAILKLSSYAARHLAECNYRSPLLVNWTGETNAETVREELSDMLLQNERKDITNLHPFALPARLWEYIVAKAIPSQPSPTGDGRNGAAHETKCRDIGKKTINRLTELLTADPYTIASRCHYKDEFVTCGGVSLDTVDKNTLESKTTPNLFYAGEVLDIDGITGGFNLQAAWTTAYTVAQAIAKKTQIDEVFSTKA